MNTVVIPDRQIGPHFRMCGSTFNINLNESVQKYLQPGQELTNELALKIFKKIKLKSDFMAFITKPVVMITTAVALLIAGFAIPPINTALVILGILVCAIAGGLLGFSIENTFRSGFLPKLSQAYHDQSVLVSQYIRDLKGNNADVRYVLND